MRDRLDFDDLPTSLVERLTPSARVADPVTGGATCLIDISAEVASGEIQTL